AADADTLGGKPASAYLLSPAPEAPAKKDSVSGPLKGVPSKKLSGAPDSVKTLTGTFNEVDVQFSDTSGTVTGYAVQNLGGGANSYSGMLFFDQNGGLGQFQGFNNSTHEYRINNIASGGSINFMIGGSSKLLVANNGSVGLPATSATGSG